MTEQELESLKALLCTADKGKVNQLREWLNDRADISCECGMEGSEGARCIVCLTIARPTQ